MELRTQACNPQYIPRMLGNRITGASVTFVHPVVLIANHAGNRERNRPEREQQVASMMTVIWTG